MDTNKLRGEIVEKYRTQLAFADKIGWHRNKVTKMMKGTYKPDIDEAAAIADVLGLNNRRYCEIFRPRKSPNGENAVM